MRCPEIWWNFRRVCGVWLIFHHEKIAWKKVFLFTSHLKWASTTRSPVNVSSTQTAQLLDWLCLTESDEHSLTYYSGTEMQHFTMMLHCFLLLQMSLISAYTIAAMPAINVRPAATYADFFDIIAHKHQAHALLAGYSNIDDYYHSRIERMLMDTTTRSFMAFKGEILVGCADLLTRNVGTSYHVQNVIVDRDHRR